MNTEQDYRRTWGDRVRTHRLHEQLSQTDLADLAGLSPSAVSMLESGDRAPSDPVKIAIARALKTDPETLFPYDDVNV